MKVGTRMVHGQGPEDTGLLFSEHNDPLTFDSVTWEIGLRPSEFTVGCAVFKSLKATFSDRQAGRGSMMEASRASLIPQQGVRVSAGDVIRLANMTP